MKGIHYNYIENNNTNIKTGRVQNYYDKLKKANANVQIIIIDTPKEICKERRKEHIPEKVIDDMQLGLDKVKERIIEELKKEITLLAKSLPVHTVVPYANIKKKNY